MSYNTPPTPAERARRARRRQLHEERAYHHRRNPSPAEARLWLILKGRGLRTTFRRQVVLGGRYIADFLARDQRLIVEVDGEQHAERAAADAHRDHYLARLGYRTLRIPAREIHADLPGVARLILEQLWGLDFGQ
ncbi:MAG: endonuclease domain-containing protein [Polyangiaceae bacterium]